MGVEPQGPNNTYLTPGLINPPKVHHRHMARLFASGFTPTEVAEATGFTCTQVSKIQASPLFQKEIARLEAMADKSACDLRQDLQSLALKAVCNLEEEIHVGDGLDTRKDLTNFERKLRYQASTDVLDRIGLGKKEFHTGDIHLHKHEEQHIHGMSVEHLRNEVMDLLRGD